MAANNIKRNNKANIISEWRKWLATMWQRRKSAAGGVKAAMWQRQ